MCIATLPVLQRKLGEHEGQFRLWGGMLIPVAALVISVWMMTHAALKSWLVTGVFMLVGGVLYLVTQRGTAAAEID
jgi:uncharacterized membrane protein HdeD (DUF308 family)